MQEINHNCDWCREYFPAKYKAQIMKQKGKSLIPTAMYMYSCIDHMDKLKSDYLADKELINGNPSTSDT